MTTVITKTLSDNHVLSDARLLRDTYDALVQTRGFAEELGRRIDRASGGEHAEREDRA